MTKGGIAEAVVLVVLWGGKRLEYNSSKYQVGSPLNEKHKL